MFGKVILFLECSLSSNFHFGVHCTLVVEVSREKKRKQQESLGQRGFIRSVKHCACANVRMLSRLSLTLREFSFSIVSKAPYYGDEGKCRNRTLE